MVDISKMDVSNVIRRLDDNDGQTNSQGKNRLQIHFQ